jgi:hypothetical protein
MSSQPDLYAISRNESHPDATFQIPWNRPSDYPTVIELEQSATKTHRAPDAQARMSYGNETPPGRSSSFKVRKNPAAYMLGQQHPNHTAPPAQTDITSGKRLRSGGPNFEDCIAVPKDASHKVDSGRTEEASAVATKPCRHRCDRLSSHADVTGCGSFVSPNAPSCITGPASHAHRSRSSGWMLDRWHAQPPSQEPYTPIEEVRPSRVLESRTFKDGKKF